MAICWFLLWHSLISNCMTLYQRVTQKCELPIQRPEAFCPGRWDVADIGAVVYGEGRDTSNALI